MRTWVLRQNALKMLNRSRRLSGRHQFSRQIAPGFSVLGCSRQGLPKSLHSLRPAPDRAKGDAEIVERRRMMGMLCDDTCQGRRSFIVSAAAIERYRQIDSRLRISRLQSDDLPEQR